MTYFWALVGIFILVQIIGHLVAYAAHRPAIKRLEAREPQVYHVDGTGASAHAKCAHCDFTVAKFKVHEGKIRCLNCEMKGRE